MPQIFPDQILERIQRRFRFVSRPTLDPLFGVSVLMLEDMGEHQVRVYRVREEYQELYSVPNPLRPATQDAQKSV